MQRRVTPKFWMIMTVITVMVFGFSFGVLQGQYNKGARELERMRDYRDELDLQVRDLNDALEYAQTDDYIIRAARDRLGLIMPGEVRYVNGSN